MRYGRNRLARGAVVLVTLALVLVVGLAPAPVTAQEAELDDLEGSGTSSDPYVITDAAELQAIAEDREAHYVLGADVDASETAEWNGGSGFAPIGEYDFETEVYFEGTLDGQGHEITGLTIDRPTTSYVGLFAAVGDDAEVSNLVVRNADVRARANIGPVAGRNEGTVSDVVVLSSDVEGQESRVGGITGQNTEATLTRLVAADVDVRGDGSAGAIAGTVYDGEDVSQVVASGDVHVDDDSAGGVVGRHFGPIRNAVSTASVSGGTEVGGLVGTSSRRHSIVDSFAGGTVEADSNAGGLVGESSPGDVADSYWDEDATGQSSAAGTGSVDAQSVTTAEATGASAPDSMAGLDYESVFQPTDEYPVHQWRVEGLSLSIADAAIGEGETTSLDVQLELLGGETVSAAEVAEYDSETAIASVDAGTVQANAQGVTEIEASVLGYSDAVEVEVLEPPSIELQDASLLAPAVAEGSETSVEATFENTGGPGSERASLTVDGEAVEERSVDLDADASRTVDVSWTPEAGGEVALDGETVGDLQVVDADAVQLEGVSVPEEVGAGGTYEIAVDLASDATVPTAQTLEVRVGGETVARGPVAAAPDGSTATFEHSVDEQGPSTAVAELRDQQATATVEVVEPMAVAVDGVDAPATASVDESVPVTATLGNDGGPGGATVAFSVDDETVHEETVSLERGASTTVTANVTPSAAGDLTVAVAAGEASETATVEVAADDGSGGGGGLPGGLLAGVAAVLVAGVAGVAWRLR